MGDNLYSLLRQAAVEHADRPALVCGKQRFSYAEFGERVDRLAKALAARGIGPDAPLALLHRNCHRYLEYYFAAAALGAMFVPLNVRLTGGEIAAVLQDCRTRLLVAEDRFADLAAEAAAMVATATRPAVLPADLAGEPGHAGTQLGCAGSDEPAQLYYTSGTTGRPKGVILTHGNVSAHARAAIAELELAASDVWLHAAPLFHLADAWATWAITAVGGTHVLLADFTAQNALDTIAATGVTMTNLVPTMLVRLVNHPGADPHQLRSMRRILSGGAPMAMELLKQVEALFPCEYVQTYGLTETSPYLTLSLLREEMRSLPPDQQRAVRATTGRPMKGVELKVVDGEGARVPADGATVGEIVARGPTVTPGYYRCPEETKLAFRDGWFHTGDLAHVRPDGYLNIVDRLKDMINTGGELVYSTEVENALYGHPAVAEAAVIAVPHPTWGEAVHAVVVLRRNLDCSSEELIAHCRESLAAFKTPRSVDLVAEIPRTGSGKIDKKALRRPFWS